jgi:group II intron reverse transcriptase/maturase
MKSWYAKIIDLQNLAAAWDRVKRNKPASGADKITWEQFDENIKENLKQLNIELAEHRYTPMPVKCAVVYRNDKAREIALFSMRDKVVQQSIALALVQMYDTLFPKGCCAYRSGKSALKAIDMIENTAKECTDGWFLKTDITHFFDNIDVEILSSILRKKIVEEDVITLIKDQCLAPKLTDNGNVEIMKKGIHQGSGIAPVLSNIYMREFDGEMDGACKMFIRYSDDIAIIENDEKSIKDDAAKLGVLIEKQGLSINKSKTLIGRVHDGFNFLGYHIDANGKAIPAKAEDDLAERLEGMWLTEKKLDINGKLEKGTQILNGWEQYFRGDREIHSMYEYAVVAYMTRRKNADGREEFLKSRRKQHNISKSLCTWMAGMWEEDDLPMMSLYEYEDYYEVQELDTDKVLSSDFVQGLLKLYDVQMTQESEEVYEEMMQTYTDAGAYNKAAAFSDKLNRYLEMSENRNRPVMNFSASETADPPVSLSKADLDEFMNLFIGRDDTYTQENFQAGTGRKCVQVMQPLTDEVVMRHFKGEITAGTYIQRNNSTVKYMVIDVDISKKYLIVPEDDKDKFQAYLQKAADKAKQYIEALRKLGLSAYPEESGYRGFHVWLFFTEWVPVRYVNLLESMLDTIVKADDDIPCEYFPNTAHIKPDKMGQSIKIPYGIHCKSGRRSRMLNEDFSPLDDPSSFVKDAAKFTISALKKVIASTADQPRAVQTTVTQVDTDLSAFGDISDNIRTVLEKCNLMRFLCQKARTTGYLTHFERLSILFVFGHMGEEGQDFVHTVMKFTLNYQYNTTQYFISKLKAKPIGCNKLREQYSKITAEIGCSCNFGHTKDCYPSPVLHALKNSTDETCNVTIPTSRTLTKENAQEVHDQLNTNQQVTMMAQKIVDFRKQQRGIDKSIEKCERELSNIFDSCGVDCMEVEFGMLTRRRKPDNSYEWVIEI